MATRASYNTRPLRLIRETLADSGHSHMTVEEILSNLKERGEKIGLTTVYRNLDKLCEQGEVKKYRGDGGYCFGLADRCEHHFHLRCESCGRLLHIECEKVQQLSDHVSVHHGFRVYNSKTVLYGTCGDCAK